MHKHVACALLVYVISVGGLVAGFEDSQNIFGVELLVTATEGGGVGNER